MAPITIKMYARNFFPNHFTKMSKALRIVTEEATAMPFSSLPVDWHPFYTSLTDSRTPCYPEFMRLSECMNTKQTLECWPQYEKLLKCLRSHGFDR
jgi:hypothetical protein